MTDGWITARVFSDGLRDTVFVWSDLRDLTCPSACQWSTLLPLPQGTAADVVTIKLEDGVLPGRVLLMYSDGTSYEATFRAGCVDPCYPGPPCYQLDCSPPAGWVQLDPVLALCPGSSVGVIEEPALLDARIQLRSQPNPFQTSARVSFKLPSRDHAAVHIYNVAGQRVRTLFDGDLAAGDHVLEWNGRSDAGNALPPGVYFCQVHTPAGPHSRKMIMLE